MMHEICNICTAKCMHAKIIVHQSSIDGERRYANRIGICAPASWVMHSIEESPQSVIDIAMHSFPALHAGDQLPAQPPHREAPDA